MGFATFTINEANNFVKGRPIMQPIYVGESGEG